MENDSLNNSLESLKLMLGNAGNNSSALPDHFLPTLNHFFKEIDLIGPFGRIGPPVEVPTPNSLIAKLGYGNLPKIQFDVSYQNSTNVKCPHCGNALQVTVNQAPFRPENE